MDWIFVGCGRSRNKAAERLNPELLGLMKICRILQQTSLEFKREKIGPLGG